MRILHAVQELRAAGAERIVTALVSGAQRAGHDVAIAAAAGQLEREVDAPVYPLPIVGRRPWRMPGAAAALGRGLRAARSELVHVHNPGMAAIAALTTLRGRRLPCIVTMHGVREEDYRAAARVLRLAGFPVVACGPGVALALEEQGLRVRTTIVNGVGAPPSPANRAGLAHEWEIDADRPFVLSVGRLVEQKNHVLAIRALVEVPAAILIIVGEGPLADELRELASELGVSDRVVLVGERPDARAIIGAADTVVLPSRWEGLPLVALETLSAGRPLVATDVRGIRELLTDGENALLVPSDDPAALAAAVNRTLADDGLRQRLHEGALLTAALHTEDAMVAEYLRLYEELLGS